jgi:hypothetical protein
MGKNETPLAQIYMEYKMKKLILVLCIALTGQGYSQKFNFLPSYMTTSGLEIDDLDGFSVIVNDLNNELKVFGLNEEQILRKLKLVLKSNNTPANGTERYPYLGIAIKGIEVKHKKEIIGYNVIFQAHFMRFVNFETEEKSYEQIVSTWNVQNFVVFSADDLKESSMEILTEMIDFFSKKLVEANKK